MNYNVKRSLEIAIFAGKLMLENGAETYRVEETINAICKSQGIEKVQNFTIPTGIFLSCENDGQYYSYIERTKTLRIDLEIISLVNDFSRELVDSRMSLEEAENRLEVIAHAPMYPKWVMYLFGGVAGGFFTLMFEGNAIEFLLAFVTSVLVVMGVREIGKITKSFFIKNVLGGMINTVMALSLAYVFKDVFEVIRVDKIIIGSIMPLVPGVAITNALRDSISGDFVSGVSKLSEAIIIAIAIAIGVGAVLNAQLLLTGGIR